MKIMFIGAATSNHTKRWVNSLVEKNHEVLLISRADQIDDKKEISKKVKIKYLKFGGGLGYYLNVVELKKIIRDFKPDVVNAHYATGYGTLARLAKARPLLISCWGSDIYKYPKKNKFNKYLLKKNLMYADGVASTSIAMAKEAEKFLNLKENSIFITPFGVDTNIFFPNRDEHERLRIGIVKYLEPIYDIELLIKAFSIVYSSRKEKPILEIIGDGSLKSELIKLTEDLKIKDAVIFRGIIPNKEVPKYINSMDIFVNCSLQESFGVALVEAMSCEVPVVATDTEGFSEIVNNGVDGIILKDRKPETMAEALNLLLDNETLRKQMGKNGRKKVLELYNWDKNVETMENLYNLLKKR